MPQVQWTDLRPALRDHLFEGLRERKITAEDLYHTGAAFASLIKVSAVPMPCALGHLNKQARSARATFRASCRGQS